MNREVEVSSADEKNAEERRAEQFLRDAYALETQADTQAFYERWAEEYDAQLQRGLHYLAPREVAETLAGRLGVTEAPILDVGCGTGLTGACLRELGFTTIDGLDFSRAMLAKAGQKMIYRRLIEADLHAALPIDDAAYAALVSSGTFTLGHVGPEPLDGLLRVLEPGGLLVCTVHEKVWDSQGFAAKFDALEGAGSIRTVEQRSGCFFAGAEAVARYCVYAKC